jgi:trigger factor
MTDIETSVESQGAVVRRLSVRVPADRVSAAFDEAYDKLRNRAKIAGFRKGKVPRKVLELHYGDSVREDVVKDLIERSCAEALRTHELDAVSAPVLVDQTFSNGDALAYTADVEIRPQFELRDWKGRDLVVRVGRVSENDVDDAIGRLRERMAQLVTEEDRVNVARGDVVVFDMTASSEGKQIDSASGEGYTLEVGAGRFPEDLEKGLIGITRGIPTPIDVRFPDEHADAELAGRLVRFDVTVREIKNKVLPPLDDDFVRELDFKDCDTLADLRAKVREDLERHSRADADRRARNRLLEQLVDEHSFEVPRSHVDRQIVSMLHDMGIHEVPREKVDELRGALEPAAVKHVKARFLLDAVVRAEAIEVTQEEIENEVRRQLAAAGSSADRVREYYSDRAAVAQLYADMSRDKALRRIIENSAQRVEEVDKTELAEGSGTRYAR